MKNLKIGIAGVGGIGSNVALHLVRSGITNLKFGDFDKVEISNLNRQFYFLSQIGEYKTSALSSNLKAINPNISCYAEVIKFDNSNISTFFQDCDIIVEGFDKKEEKNMFFENFFSTTKKIYLVNGIAGIDTENIKIVKLRENITLVGDFISDLENNKLYSHKVNCISCKIAELILKEVYER